MYKFGVTACVRAKALEVLLTFALALLIQISMQCKDKYCLRIITVFLTL
jgi:hypothetical protein